MTPAKKGEKVTNARRTASGIFGVIGAGSPAHLLHAHVFLHGRKQIRLWGND
jgi:hypothetical protein